MEIEVQTPNGILYPLDRFSYTRQVGDIGDIEASASSHTNSFTVRSDNESIRVLEGLSLIGSQSRVPYRKTPSSINVDNYRIVKSGWLQVESNDGSKFKLSLLDGNVDFWKLIDGVSLGDIDLSETIHDKTAANIVASFNNDYYKYILGDYGVPHDPLSDEWNGDFLVPSINEQYVFDRIFDYINMDKELSVPIDTWLTYPKDVYDEFGFSDSLVFNVNPVEVAPVQLDEKIRPTPDSVVDSADVAWDLPAYTATINTDGVYKISQTFSGLQVKAIFRKYLTTPLGKIVTGEYESYAAGFMQIYVNGVFKSTLAFNGSEANIQLYAGDDLEIVFSYYTDTQFYAGVPENSEIAFLEYYRIFDYELKIQRHNFIEISFTDAFREITARDFIKYIMMRYGLTLFVEDNKAIFLTAQERLTADYQDLSEYVKEKIDERYVYPNYAVKNAFRHKYVNPSDEFQDGFIYGSENLMEEVKTVFESFTFSRTRSDSMPVFEANVKNSGGSVVIEYKGVLGRFFSLRYKMVEQGSGDSIDVITEKVPASENYSGELPMADFEMTTFRQYVPEYWQPVERLIQNAKLMKYRLDLSLPRFMNLDLKKRIYLEQEASFFLINKATIKDTGNVEMEIVKID